MKQVSYDDSEKLELLQAKHEQKFEIVNKIMNEFKREKEIHWIHIESCHHCKQQKSSL
jgi:hypothetical protein